MGLYKNTFRIETNRLKDWDYSIPWWYYTTICTKEMECWFGRVQKESIILNSLGKTVNKFWTDIPKHYSNVEIDYFVIMPNHFQ